ncbi:MAG: two-component regulator propeller domain-containing protein [bacterium]
MKKMNKTEIKLELKEKWQTFTEWYGLAGNAIFSIIEDRQGNLWFGTNGGVTMYDGKDWKTWTTRDGLASDAVRSIIEDRKGNLWFGTWEKGVSRYDGRKWKTFTEKDGLAHNWVTSILEDRQGNLWFGTDRGVTMYDGRKWKPFRKTFTEKDGLASNAVWSIIEDRQGNLWFGTTGGVSMYDGRNWKTWTTKDRLAGDRILSILEDRQGNLWFGTWRGEVRRYDGKDWKTWTIKDGLHSNKVHSILEDRQGNLWFGTDRGEVKRYDGRNWKTWTTKDRLASNEVRSIIEDRQGNLWFGTDRGVSMYDGRDWKTWTTKNGLAGNIIEDKQGNLWFGTWGGGVTMYDGKEWKTWTTKDGLAGNIVLSIIEDRKANLWFGTYGEGVSRYTPTHILAKGYMDDNKGLLYPVIYQIFEEAKEPSSSLKDLCELYQQEGNQQFVNILNVYYQLSLFTETSRVGGMIARLTQNPKPILSRLVEILAEAKGLPHGDEVYLTYKVFYQLTNCRAIEDIIITRVDLNKLFKCEDVLRKGTMNAFKGLNEIIEALSKYEEVEEVEAKSSYLTGSISLCEEATRFVDKGVLEPERTLLLYLLPQIREIIGRALKALTGRAEIVCELKTKEMPFRDEIEVVLEVRNIGNSVADDIDIEILTSNDYKFGMTGIAVSPISPRKARQVSFRLNPLKKGQIRLQFRITYSDFEAKGKTIDFADQISFIERQETEFREIESPYITGLPLAPQSTLFVGRSEAFDFIERYLKSVSKKNILVLTGQRRLGKTSLLNQVIVKFSSNYLPVLIDVQGIDSDSTEAKFLLTLSEKIQESAENQGIELELPPKEEFYERPASTFERLFLKKVYKLLGEKQILLMFDEFESFEKKDGLMREDIFDYLRHLMQHTQISFIFTGTHRLEEMTGNYWNVLFNIGLYHQIGVLKEKESISLIVNPTKQAMTYDKLAIDRILNLTAGHPYFIQLICDELVHLHNRERKSYITIEDVNNQLAEIIKSGYNHFKFIWDTTSNREKLLLSLLPKLLPMWESKITLSNIIIALAENKIQAKKEDVTETLRNLMAKEIVQDISIDGISGHYRFKGDIYRVWLERYKKRAIDEEKITWEEND